MLPLSEIRKNYPAALQDRGAFLQQKLNIDTPENLRKHLIAACQNFDFPALAHDVQAFLFHPEEVRRVLLFREYVETAAW